MSVGQVFSFVGIEIEKKKEKNARKLCQSISLSAFYDSK